MEFTIWQCTVCEETSYLNTQPKNASKYLCLRCSRDKHFPRKFSKENNMIPAKVPSQLQELTQIEEMLISRALPIMRVYIKPGGQKGYSGHCINLPQDVKELASSLPRYPKDLPLIVVKMKEKENSIKSVTVRKGKVHAALLWLISNNPHYSDMKINLEALQSLQENGMPSDLPTVETENDNFSDHEEQNSLQTLPFCYNSDEDVAFNQTTEKSSFLPLGQQQEQQMDAIRKEILGEENSINWPNISNQPLNEYQTSHLASMAFPTLFPDGKGDPTNPSLLRDVPFQEKVKHLIQFAENRNGQWVYRFASHPRFAYWALNMIQRKRVLQQGGIFLKQNPGEAHLTIDELQQMATSNNSAAFMSKLSRYVANIPGTNAYWHKVREELKAIVTNKGPPTFFFTFSSADMHWPELHDLFGKIAENTSIEERRQNVINNPHIVDWFFTKRLESFIKHWLYKTLDAQWHWYRYEYQHRGSIHCHGTAKLSNDPGLCELTELALKGFLAQKHKNENNCTDTIQLDEDIENGKAAANKACQYADWLLSTVNPIPPEQNIWVRPSRHPCQNRHKTISEQLERD